MLALISQIAFTTNAQQLNGFNLSDALIPVNEILRGGPPRDGIPSIDHPVFKTAGQYQEFDNSTEVLGVYYNGVAKAYPINIMDRHEIVNDHFNVKPVVVTYCPLCGSGIAFEADAINGKPTEFGVSGLLYNSDVLLYDRNTESLWSQIMAKAISGPMKGQELVPINTLRMTLRAWRNLHPETLILSNETGFSRNYQGKAYGNYDQEDRTYFPVSHNDNTFHKKEWVIGVEINGAFKAYPIKKLSKNKSRELKDELGGTVLTLSWDAKGENVRIVSASGEEIVGLQMFWFAWVAFHPDTEVYK